MEPGGRAQLIFAAGMADELIANRCSAEASVLAKSLTELVIILLITRTNFTDAQTDFSCPSLFTGKLCQNNKDIYNVTKKCF